MRVLLVEDELFIRPIAMEALGDAGFEVAKTESGDVAVPAALIGRPPATCGSRNSPRRLAHFRGQLGRA